METTDYLTLKELHQHGEHKEIVNQQLPTFIKEIGLPSDLF